MTKCLTSQRSALVMKAGEGGSEERGPTGQREGEMYTCHHIKLGALYMGCNWEMMADVAQSNFCVIFVLGVFYC